MKIKILKSDLIKNIQNVQNIISSRASLPILSNVLIETKNNNIRFTSTDLDIGITSSFACETEEEGAITVPAKRFSDIIKELPNEDVFISTMKNNSMSIKCEKCFFKILGLPKEDFPKLPSFEQKPHITLSQSVLKKMLTMTYFSISHDETRYVLNGALFMFKGNQLTIVTTDGKRLSLVRQCINTNTDQRSFIVPSKTIYELNRVLEDVEEDVGIVFTENQVRFEIKNIIIISRLIEGEFPNYEQVIPKEVKDKIVLDREKFLLSVKRAALLTTQDSQAIKIDILKNKVIVSKSNPNIGEAKEEIDALYTGHDITTGFNPGYLTDILKVIPKDDLALEILGHDKPAVVRIDDWCIYLVLPIQLV